MTESPSSETTDFSDDDDASLTLIDLSESPPVTSCYIDLTEDNQIDPDEVAVIETRPGNRIPSAATAAATATATTTTTTEDVVTFSEDPRVVQLRDQAAQAARSLLAPPPPPSSVGGSSASGESRRKKPKRRRGKCREMKNPDEDDVVLVQDLEVVEVSASKVKGPQNSRTIPDKEDGSSNALRKTITCPVCLDTAQQILADRRRQLVSTICGHVFCVKCIRAAVQQRQACPTCRKRLTLKQFHPLYL